MRAIPHHSSQQTRQRPPSGMTLVELLAATVLSTLLMGAVLGLLASITRSQRTILKDHGVQDLWQTRLQELLEWDLQNSRSLSPLPNGVQLDGFAGRDFSTGSPLHCPCRITYEIIEDGDRRHLIRRESHTDSLSLDNATSSLVCLDIGQIVMGTSPPRSDSTNSSNASKGRSDGGIPEQVSVSLLSSIDGRVISFRFLTIGSGTTK